MMPGILNRYILRETAQTWVVVTMVLLLILMTNQFAQVLGDAASNKLPKQAVMLVMGLTSLQYLTILVPIGLFLAIMIALGRLYRDSEMAAIMACGIGPLGLYRPLAPLALILAGGVGWLALEVAPSAVREVETIAAEAKQRADLRMLEAGRFIGFGNDSAVMYAESLNADGTLTNVFVQRRTGGRVEVIVAKTAWQSESEQEGIKLLRFANGKRYEGRPGSSRFRMLSFEEHGIPFETPAVDPVEVEPATRPLAVLLGSRDAVDRAELQWRLSPPITVLVLTLIAVPLSRSAPRKGRYGGLATGVLIYITYLNLLGAAKVWVERGEVPVWAGIWWVHIVMLVVGVLMLAQQFGYLRRFYWWRDAGSAT